MFNSATIIAVILFYIGLLFLIGQWGERKTVAGRKAGDHPLIYSLSLAIYCTSWTYYGSVGNAAVSGMFFLTIYLGPTLIILLWWKVLRKLIRLKNSQRITSIADFLAARYGKSQFIAALATVIALVGTVPYIALQLKAIISTFAIIIQGNGDRVALISDHIGPVVVGLMIFFTIAFGVRRLDPTERHQGIVVVVAAESLVKLVTFLAVGIFVTYYAFDGLADIFQRLQAHHPPGGQAAGPPPFTWFTYLLLSMSAILFLPRQFHISVVENSDEGHLRTAMWLFPLYMLLINFFVYPLAQGGVLAGLSAADADTFVLKLPLHFGQEWLALAVFIGGFSAATGMVMISAMTLATMSTNHLLLPAIDTSRRFAFLRRHLLKARWAAVALIILSSYWFEMIVGSSYSLVRMGIISFAAALQFAPSILGGLFWARGNRVGAILGLSAGFLFWGYTVIVPSFVRSGWLSSSLLTLGPGGLSFLRPEQLFGLSGLDPLSHAVVWTLVFNIGLYVFGSLLFEVSDEELRQAHSFVRVLAADSGPEPGVDRPSAIDLAAKREALTAILTQYFPAATAASIFDQCLSRLSRVPRHGKISVVELADLCNEIEKKLAGTIGTAAAHAALKRKMIFSPDETQALQGAYSELLAGLSVTPEDLKRKIDYYREREQLVLTHAAELEEKVALLNEQIRQRIKTEEALRQSEGRLQAIIDHSPAVIYLKDVEGRYMLVNRQFETLFDISALQVRGRTDHEIFPEDLAYRLWTNDRHVLSIKRYYQVEKLLPLTDGPRSYLAVKFPLLSTDGAITGICSIATDVTELKKAQEQLRRLSGSIMAAQEQERRAIARELHDELGQVLTALRLDSAWLTNRLQEKDALGAERAAAMRHLIDKTIDEVRGISIRLRPGALDDLGLIDALEWLSEDFEKRNEATCIFTCDPIPSLDDLIATAAYRISQEALTNVVRHARASQVEIALRFDGHALTLSVIDNGRGFDLERLEEAAGMGIAGMQERANLLGGNVSIRSAPGAGTGVFFQLPVQMRAGKLCP